MPDQRPGGPMSLWTIEALSTDVVRTLDRLRQLPDAKAMAVLPDVHRAADVCVGVALATTDYVYPAAVGGDIGCGMLAVGLDIDARFLASAERAAELLSDLYDFVPSHQHAGPQELLEGLLASELSHRTLEQAKLRTAARQLGTLGGGNHFVEFQSDDHNRLWLMIHSGSRGIGQMISNLHALRCVDRGGLPGLLADSDEGRAYLHDVGWARMYAAANRLQMARAVERWLAGHRVAVDWETLIHSDHNHVARELHHGAWVWVHRKGAMPAEDGQQGVIPGSMGTISVHVVGRGCADSLRTCSHGAGRRLTRQAARQRSRRDLLREMGTVWFDRRFVDDLRDEAPGAYKNLRAVLRAQHALIRIVRELRPVLVYKGA